MLSRSWSRMSGAKRAQQNITAEERAVAAELDAACRAFGFFHISGHGIAPVTMNGVLRASHLFFGLPLSSKQAVRAGAGDATAGERDSARYAAARLPWFAGLFGASSIASVYRSTASWNLPIL